MKRSNWNMLKNQYEYIREMDRDILDAIDSWKPDIADDLSAEQSGREEVFIKMVMEVLEDEKYNLSDK